MTSQDEQQREDAAWEWERLQRVVQGLSVTALNEACPAGLHVNCWYGEPVPTSLLADPPRREAHLGALRQRARFGPRPGHLVGPLVVDREYARGLHERLVAVIEGVPVDEFRWPLPDTMAVVCVGLALPGR